MQPDEQRPGVKQRHSLTALRAMRMKAFLDASQRRRFPVSLDLLGIRLTILEGVFAPDWYLDAEFFGGQLLRLIAPGRKVLEIGSGSGAVSVALAKHGAEVTAVDASPKAVRNTIANASLNGVAIRAYESDVFDGVDAACEHDFDFVFWDVPFGYCYNGVLSELDRAIMDPGYQSVTRYVREATTYLHPEGRLLLGFSTTLGDHEALSRIAVSAGYSLRELAETVDVEGESLELIELTRDSNFAP